MTLDIKICGLTTAEAVDASARHGATHIGFIFFAKSPRFVTPEAAGALAAAHGGRARRVAVVVDMADDGLDAIVVALRPDLLQLHGSESPERLAEIRRRYDLPVMKALPVRASEDLSALKAYAGIADRFLLDAKPPPGSELPGGNGVAFDWSVLDHLRHSHRYRGADATRILLSGGLSADNIGEALAAAGDVIGGIDVSSGVERAPGLKDTGRIAAFFRAVDDARRSRVEQARRPVSANEGLQP